MMERDETLVIADAGSIYEIIKGDSDRYILNDEELKDNARQLRYRAIAESKKKLPTLVGIKQNRHYINVRNRL
jgi:hypothetical protein